MDGTVESDGRLRASTPAEARPSYPRTEVDVSGDGRDNADIALTYHINTPTRIGPIFSWDHTPAEARTSCPDVTGDRWDNVDIARTSIHRHHEEAHSDI